MPDQIRDFWFGIYLKVLMVAKLFSTVSGVLVRSCDPSLGAILVAQMLNYLLHQFDDDDERTLLGFLFWLID